MTTTILRRIVVASSQSVIEMFWECAFTPVKVQNLDRVVEDYMPYFEFTRISSSTRRLRCRPLSVAFEAIGMLSP